MSVPSLFLPLHMQRKFLSNLILLLTLNILVKGFWILGIDRGVQNAVGAQEYGLYFSIINFSFLLNILLDFGITNFNNRNIAQNWHLLSKHLPGILAMKWMLGLLYMAATLIAAWALGYQGHQMKLLLWLAANQLLLSLTLYLRSNLSGLHLFRTDSFLSVLDRSLMILFCGWFLWGSRAGDFKIEWFVYCQTAAYAITAFVAFLVVVKRSGFRRLQWKPLFFLMILRKSWPFAVLVLLMTFYNRIDSVMLERMLPDGEGERQAGIYASAYRLLDAVNMIAYLFATLLLPIFSRMIKLKQDLSELVRLAYSILFFVAIVVTSIAWFYAQPLMDLLYIDHVNESARIFAPLIFGFIPIATTYVFGTLLTANGNLKLLNIVALSGMVVNIILNIILIPRYMAMGSVIASLITQFIMSGIQVLGTVKIFRMKTDWIFLGKLALFTGLTYASLIVIGRLDMSWTHGMLLAALASSVFAFAVRLIRPGVFLAILRDG
jgi:O-antigen/teichoic acid export membrane protein